jgi:hypothetical protein
VSGGRLNVGSCAITDPAAHLDSPGMAVIYLTTNPSGPGSFLSFTTAQAARQLAAACTRAAELLDGPQVVPAT